MQINNISRILGALNTADGSVVTPDENGDVTLATGTYVFLFGGTTDALLQSVHIMTDASIAWSGLTIETCNLPRNTDKTSVARGDAVSDWSTTTGHWIKEDPSTAYVATTGTGWTVTNLTLVKTAGAGGAMIHLGNMGAARSRGKVVVTTAGKMRVAGSAKA